MDELIPTIIRILVIFLIIFTLVAYYTLAERKFAGYFQRRPGPHRAGPFGLLQPLADGLKFFFKEEMMPTHVNKWLYLAAPAASLIVALLVYAVIPFGGSIDLPRVGHVDLAVAPNVNIGLLYILAVSSLGVYGIILAGWSSNNKYSLLAALRASAQMISYELALGLSIVAVVMNTGTFYLYDIVADQSGGHWLLWRHPLAWLAFLIFIVAIFAETNRVPFDLAEAESELVVGFHTEYGSIKWMLFFVAEYMNMLSLSCLTAVLFFGGWDFFGLNTATGIWHGLINIGVFTLKAGFFAFFFIWVRWTLPRFRYDQLMRLGWKVLLPLALFNIFATGIWYYAGPILKSIGGS